MSQSEELLSSGTREVVLASENQVAMFDLSDRTQIEVTGADRAQFLHALTSNEVKRLRPGEGRETFITNIKGKSVAHLYMFCTATSLWLDGVEGQTETILNHLKKYLLIEDAQIHPHTGTRGELFVTGPMSLQLLQVEELTQIGQNVERDNGQGSIHFRRVDLLGKPGILMSMATEQIPAVKQGLAGFGVVEGTRNVFEVLRIGAGFPRFGVDLTDSNLVQEAARTRQAVSFTKGCYLGQETIARLDALGHTNEELRSIRFSNATSIRPGTAVLDSNEQPVGTITSAAVDLHRWVSDGTVSAVALATIKRVALKSGTPVIVKQDDQRADGIVV